MLDISKIFRIWIYEMRCIISEYLELFVIQLSCWIIIIYDQFLYFHDPFWIGICWRRMLFHVIFSIFWSVQQTEFVRRLNLECNASSSWIFLLFRCSETFFFLYFFTESKHGPNLTHLFKRTSINRANVSNINYTHCSSFTYSFSHQWMDRSR